ncbi:MAG: hypothetical protein ACFFA0_08450 [Promethearchaeota archaeon]
MSFNPGKIREEFENNRIDKSTALELLTASIENCNNDEIRLEAIKNLMKLAPFNDKTFKILENLLISDENEKIRYLALKYIGDKFFAKAFYPLKWAFSHEEDYRCLIETIKLLGKLNNKQTKMVLFNEIKQISKKKYLNNVRKIENKKYKKVLKKLLKEKKHEEFTHNELTHILINFYTISNLFTQYHNVYYELNSQTGLIEKLDLSDYLEYEVKGTPWNWKNNIRKLSDIPGFNNLSYLKQIDLSNNNIKNVRNLIQFQELTHLILTNNQLSIENNLNYLKKLPNLIYLDIRGNPITKYINSNDFPPHIHVLFKDSYLKIK